MTAWSWEDLRARSFARQLPTGTSDLTVAALVARTGPIQSQTARSPFVGLAARRPGTTHADVTEAYESLGIVRGSTLRGTVHTATPAQHATLDAVTRLGQRALWTRTLRPERTTLEDLWESLEAYAEDEWRTPAELLEHLRAEVAARESEERAARLDGPAGRYFAFGHGGLVRRPLTGGWAGQGAPGYRAARSLLAGRRPPLPSPGDAVDDAVRRHLAAHGPATRHDLAWWSGLGLRVVDAALARLAGELVAADGPDGRTVHDLREGVPEPVDPAADGVRLLPEFDAVLCGYNPRARARFVDDDHHRALWHEANGVLRPPVLRGGRVVGHWRLEGTGRTRSFALAPFRGTGRVSRAALADPVAALAAALDLTISSVTVEAAR